MLLKKKTNEKIVAFFWGYDLPQPKFFGSVYVMFMSGIGLFLQKYQNYGL